MDTERDTVYVVDRGSPKLRAGQGLAAGLGVVLRHFRDAFGKKLDSPEETSGVFTVQYPEERLPLPEAYRNFPILLYDDTSKQELCTSCFQCQRICPPQVIHMTQAKDPVTGKAVPAVAEFVIEYDACMSCGLCAEVCPFDAIKMDHEFELATDVHHGLTLNKEQLNRPISYYERLAPGFWAEARDAALKKLEGNAKRRPVGIGQAGAPDNERRTTDVDNPKADDRPLIVAAPALTTDHRPPTATTPTPSEPSSAVSRPPSAPGDVPPMDKAAKLAAIRAANAAKQTALTGQTTDDRPPTAAAPDDAPPMDKAAKLAAIRAANAAKQAALTGQTTDDRPPTATTPDDAPPMDKVAKLAAIRAANAAKRAEQTNDQRPVTNADEPSSAVNRPPSDPPSEQEHQP